jgi:TfoX/Sxy family transcriptional regulator of competence genes
MAYDEALAARVRAAVEDEPGLSEKTMFGGHAFLVHGNMAVAASGQGGLLLRVDPAESSALTAQPHVERFVMRGRAMAGWLHVGLEAVATPADLQRWVDTGLAYARSLPAK